MNPRYGGMGLFVYPYFVFVELLAPVVEAIGWIGLIAAITLGALDLEFALLFLLIGYGLGAILNLVTRVMEEVTFARYRRLRDRLLLVLWALVENLGYRQLTVIWQLRGLWNFLLGSRTWGAMERKGFHVVGAYVRE